MSFEYDTDTVGAGLPAKRPVGSAHIPDQSAQLIAKLPGVIPVQRLNARLKLLVSANPSR